MLSGKRRILLWTSVLLLLLAAAGCYVFRNVPERTGLHTQLSAPEAEFLGTDENPYFLIDSSGQTLEGRIAVPEGYTRVPAAEGSFAQFVRNLELLPDGSEVTTYRGTAAAFQNAAAVFAMDVGTEDLQQCADSVMRLYCEYLYQAGQEDLISFSLTNGMEFSYTDWKAGRRLIAAGSFSTLLKLGSASDGSYDSLCNYMHGLMRYAGTKSLKEDCETVAPEDLKIGDLFLIGGTPGHVFLLADLAEDPSGSRVALLAQGFMPAQSFHILWNEFTGNAETDSPWFSLDALEEGFTAGGYRFSSSNYCRWQPLTQAEEAGS